MRRRHLLEIVDDLRILGIWLAVVDVFHGLHHLVAHIQAQFPHFPLLHQPPVFPLSLPSSRPHPVPPLDLLLRQLGLLDVGRGLGGLGHVLGLLQGVVWWGWLVLRVLLLLLLLLLGRVSSVGHDTDSSISVALSFAALPLSSLLALDPLAVGLALAWSLAG
jgi:hypothetical protein